MLLVAQLRRIDVVKMGQELHEMFGVLSAGFFIVPIAGKRNV